MTQNVLWSCVSVCVSVCLCVCLSHGPGCNLGEWQGMPLIVQYWVDLQSVRGLHCCGNITQIVDTSLPSSLI